MKLFSFRPIFVVILTLFSAWAIRDFSKYRLGPDLSGGTILVYEVAPDGRKNMDRLISALKNRVDPSGIYDYKIRPLGEDRVEIILPQSVAEDKEQVKRLISTVGKLQFRIVANRRMHNDIIERADAEWPKRMVGSEAAPDAIFTRYGVWTPVDKTVPANQALVAKAEEEFKKGNRTVDGHRFIPFTLIDDEKPNPAVHLVIRSDSGQSLVLATWADEERVYDASKGNLIKEDDEGNHFVLLIEPPENMKVDGEYLTRAERTLDQGNPAVSFQLNAVGAAKFWELTSAYKPAEDGHHNQLAVVLDNRVRSAPVINQPIRDSGLIRMGSGANVKEEVDRLLRVLDTGALPAAVSKEPTSEFGIAATLGQDTIDRAKVSNVVALLIVMIFMVVYYRFAGGVAVFGLVLNLMFTVALMVLFKATWTMPGLAGLVLTLGMSVDANVLIYERMREELDRGASVGMAIRLGYEKALSTIVDSNLTTILTAVILYTIGTDQVRGFAVTLILGLLTSMFAALFVTRTVFDLFYELRLIKKLSMLKFLTGYEFNFIAMRKLFYTISIVLIAVGMAAIAYRGKDNLDIDFTGGTMVAMRFKQPLTTEKVRERLRDIPDASVEMVTIRGVENGTYYIVRTTDRDEANSSTKGGSVRERLAASFKDSLTYDKVEYTPPAKIAKQDAQADAKVTFQDGVFSTVTFDQPQTELYVKSKINDLLIAENPGLLDPETRYVLRHVGEASIKNTSAGEVAAFKQYRLETESTVAALLPKFKQYVESQPNFEQYVRFGPQVAGETQTRAIWAIVLSWIGIIIYVWFRFNSWAFGIAGVAALVHDVLASLGLFALFSLIAKNVPGLENVLISEMKIDLNVVAAVLTLIGYSINDTIVIFDRIREVRGKSPTVSEEMANKAINETLSRTVITSLLTLLTVIVLYIGCGTTLRGFAFILLVGIITGSYSTIFVATPIALAIMRAYERRQVAKGSEVAVASR